MAGEKILIVDDEKEMLDLLDKKLSAEKYQVIKASTGKGAVDCVRKHLPRLILMDIVLPDMEGPEAVRLLSEDPLSKNIPVLFLSGIVSKEEEMAHPEINVGGRLYKAVSKPFLFTELLGEIRKLLE